MVEILGAELLILPAILIGTVLSIIELYFVAGDEAGLHWFRHGMHAIPFMYLFVFLTMNTAWALNIVGFGDELLYVLGAQVLVGIIAFVKIKFAVSVTGRGRIGESNIHLLIIMLLIIGAPYIWELGLEPFLGDMLTL